VNITDAALAALVRGVRSWAGACLRQKLKRTAKPKNTSGLR